MAVESDLDIQTTGYKESKDSTDEIRKTHSTIQFIGPQKKVGPATRNQHNISKNA
jgi:hypothetical protein